MADREPNDFLEKLALTLDPAKLDESVREVAGKLKSTASVHRYSKVRLSYKGKALMPDIPLALFLAGEAASFWLAGPLRVIMFNLGMGALVDVELVHDADEQLRTGQDLFLRGEVDEAEEAYRRALVMRPDDTAATYALGVLLRVTGRRTEAMECFEKAAEDKKHPDGELARQALLKMKRGGKTL